jgi:predicted nucleic acid-binding Zn ribbon protein
MINKERNCLYCNAKFTPISNKAKCCSAKCRVYYNRDKSSEKVNIFAWRDAKLDFPQFDKKVLGLFTIHETDGKGKKTDNIIKYYEIIHCESVTEYASGKKGAWRNSAWDEVQPILWCELPEYPSLEN